MLVALGLAGAAVLSGSASAAPPLRASVSAPGQATVDRSWRAVVTVTRGARRIPGLRVRVLARAGAQTEAAVALPTARRGVYAARLVFSSPGRWSYAVVVRSRTLRRGSVNVTGGGGGGGGTVVPPPPPPGPRCLPGGPSASPPSEPRFREWSVASGAQVHPHDIWPAGDGTVWYTGQFNGTLGRLNTATGSFCEIPLGAGAHPHGVIAGPDGDAWVTDQGRNSIIRVDSATQAVTEYPMPAGLPNVLPHTGVWDVDGNLWFTGNAGFVGRVVPATGAVTVWPAPRGGGPYGIDGTPAGDLYYVSLQPQSYLGRIDRATGATTTIDPPRPGIEFRRVWSDSQGRLWASEWVGGRLARYTPSTGTWREWAMPGGAASQGYAIYVDAADVVWITDFGTNALVRFDPVTETFQSFPYPSPNAFVRQIVGDAQGIWGPESGTDKLVLFRP
jgi:virginiamycin B lyase